MIHETPRIYIDSDDFFAHLEFSRPGRAGPGRVGPGPAGPLVCVEGKKSENGQYLAVKFSQRRGGLGVKITISTRVRSNAKF